MNSGVLTSPEYRKLQKSLVTKRKEANKKAAKNPALPDNLDGGKSFYGNIEVEAVIKGKDGKRYKVTLSDNNGTTDEYFDISNSGKILCLEDQFKFVDISHEQTEKTSDDDFRIATHEGVVLHEKNRESPDSELKLTGEALIKRERERMKKEKDSYDKALSRPNIAGVVKLLGGPLESPTKGEK